MLRLKSDENMRRSVGMCGLEEDGTCKPERGLRGYRSCCQLASRFPDVTNSASPSLSMHPAAVLLLCCVAVATAKNDFIRPCRRSEPDLDGCIAKSIQHLRSYLITGIPEYGVPSIEPLRIPRIQMENGVGSVRVKAQFHNITVKGASNHTLENIRSNIKNYKMVLTLSAPKLEATGRYDVSGVVLLFNIRSKGDFWASFDGGVGVATIQGKEITREGVTYMKIDKVHVDFKVDRARFKIKDFSRSRVFGDAINNFLNGNWREILEEMKGAAGHSFSKYIKEILNGAFLNIPLNEWLLDDTILPTVTFSSSTANTTASAL